MVFQDPYACLDPRMTIEQSVAEPLRALAPELDATARSERVAGLLHEVGLAPELARRYPHQTSGGQLQRAVIARALVVDPEFVVCDEPTSALDVSVQGQIINLLARIRRERQLTGLFISHNLALVARLCERAMVMYRGRIVEIGPRGQLLSAPLHPYTRELLDAVPIVGPAARRRAVPRLKSATVTSPVARSIYAVHMRGNAAVRNVQSCRRTRRADRSPVIGPANGPVGSRRPSAIEFLDHPLSQVRAYAPAAAGEPAD
jgi:ABC-type oligopeptide transport system ATPase subunit